MKCHVQHQIYKRQIYKCSTQLLLYQLRHDHSHICAYKKDRKCTVENGVLVLHRHQVRALATLFMKCYLSSSVYSSPSRVSRMQTLLGQSPCPNSCLLVFLHKT